MNLSSIRWRLPISYALIALLATLSLGVVLVWILRGYYDQQERRYLQGNAEQIGFAATQLLNANLPEAVLKDQVVSWSFFLQARVQLLDANNQSLADSGVPDTNQMMMVSSASAPVGGVFEQVITPTTDTQAGSVIVFSGNSHLPSDKLGPLQDCINQPAGAGTTTCAPVLVQYTSDSGGVMVSSTELFTQAMPPTSFRVGLAMPLAGSLYGFNLDVANGLPTSRSKQSVTHAITDGAGNAVGSVILSDGPAYGQEIVQSVLYGWMWASVVAVIVAGLVGWFISRQMTQPLLTLTAATTRMAAGNLATRADVQGNDEFSHLGRAFNEMATRVEETVGTLRNFVADAAHELRTPLTALRTNLELANDASAEQRATFLANAQAQATRLEAIMTGLLNLSRVEAQAGAHEAVDVDALVAELGEVYASRAEQAGLQFVVERPPRPLLVTGDRGQLTRVLTNLLDNAFKFTAPNGTITLRLSRETTWVVLSVSDTGIGIPPEDLPQMFHRFHRGRNASAYPGSGLGLAIVKAIALAHGGDAQIESSGQGVTCEVRLPVAY